MSAADLMPGWKQYIDRNAGPLYLSIVEALAESIRRDEIHEGDRLPPQRALAKALGTDLTTVTRAFAEARRRGLIEATVGRGTFVRVGATETRWRNAGRAVVDLTMNLPPIPENPSLQQLIQNDISRILRRQDLHALLSYRVTGGTSEERQLAADWMKPMLGVRPADEILVVPGAQSAMSAVVSTLAAPGDVIVTDRFTYPGIRTLAAQFGLLLAGVDSDHEGMVPDLLDRACRQHRPRLIYCTPTIQNPTTATMSLARREAILAVAKAHNVQILEDDPYSLLLDQPPPALAALDPSRVFYVSTLAKVLSPGLRLAFLVAPQDAVQRMSSAVRAISLTCSGLMTSLVARWMQDGQAQAIVQAIRTELRLRQTAARAILGEGHCMHPDGPHVWLKLPDWWGSVDFVSYARRQGLGLVPSTVFTVEGEPAQRVRIALGSAATLDSLEVSLHGVVSVLQHKRSPGYTDIV
ncbi:PLP-dependent aminotransferase family protein [Gluconacetobacter azotocaptans]|uniref:PLP-dependent aminotransferase family protein n=1 Tax=Gluconacetobacter azotocaptans TaxID=142834 RepID=A0A7W4JPF6_9PROT|nr:PLP-dependent aminotransferase family protein [Gluconacetobacter azotocaptans]MBB2188498.1 PLP-dependent aminotransferase family protein [Gluconacetobacter azotocaptans]